MFCNKGQVVISLKCYINGSNILDPYPVLLHISAAHYIGHHQVTKRINKERNHS